MKIKTAELTGLALDWALAVALELEPEISRPSPYDGSIAVLALPLPNGYPRHHKCGFFYTDPATCIGLMACEYGKVWKAEAIPRTTTPTVLVMGFSSVGADVTKANGQTLAEAVARCVVAMRLGDEVEVPDELVGVQG